MAGGMVTADSLVRDAASDAAAAAYGTLTGGFCGGSNTAAWQPLARLALCPSPGCWDHSLAPMVPSSLTGINE